MVKGRVSWGWFKVPSTLLDHSLYYNPSENASVSVFTKYQHFNWASQMVLVVKNPPANAWDIRDASSIPGSRRSPGEGHGNPLQYSCLGNPHGQRSPAGYSAKGRRVGHNWSNFACGTQEVRRGGKNTQKNYTKKIFMIQITTMVWSLT